MGGERTTYMPLDLGYDMWKSRYLPARHFWPTMVAEKSLEHNERRSSAAKAFVEGPRLTRMQV